MLDMEVTLWEDISNMRWAQRLLLWSLLLCNSTTNWKNNNALGPHMMENGLCKYGEICLNMDKISLKKNRCENEITIFFIFWPKQDFHKNNRCQFEGNIEHYGSDKRDLKRNMFAVIVLRVKTKSLKKGLKIREISRNASFRSKIFPGWKFWKMSKPM